MWLAVEFSVLDVELSAESRALLRTGKGPGISLKAGEEPGDKLGELKNKVK